MRASQAVRHIQHLASLNLQSQMVVPEMLHTLAEVIPGSFNSFFWVDRDGMLLDGYAPSAILSASAAFASAMSDVAAEPTLDKVVAMNQQIGGAQRLHAIHDYSRSTLCNEVWRPYGIGCGLDLVLREAGAARGILFVNREARFNRFTADEHRILRTLAPHFLHAVTTQADRKIAIDESEDRVGTMIVDAAGNILSTDAVGVTMMFEMNDMPLSRFTRPQTWSPRLPLFIFELIERCRRIRDGEWSEPPRTERMTTRGLYRARVFPQFSISDGRFGETPSSYSVVITRHLPRMLRLSRQLAKLDLSPRERQVAFHLGMGEEADRGAAALGVSITTWRSYVKRIYQRLEIGSRREFQTLLQKGSSLLH